jgi:hypothetical protein
MNILHFILELAQNHLYNPNCEHFGGAGLFITDKGPDTNSHGDVIVVHEDAGTLSWLVYCLKAAYQKQIFYGNKYEFYTSVGSFMNEAKREGKNTHKIIEEVLYKVEKSFGPPTNKPDFDKDDLNN